MMRRKDKLFSRFTDSVNKQYLMTGLESQVVHGYRGQLRYAAFPDNYTQISQKRNISAGKMYSTIRVLEWAVNHFGLGLTVLTIHFWRRYAQKRFYTFVHSDLDVSPLTFRPQICSPSYSFLTLFPLWLPFFEKIGGMGTNAGLYPAVCFIVSRGVWNCQGDHRMAKGHESRREAPSGGGVWGGGPGRGARRCHPWKILKFETQFGAIWCILARNLRFSSFPPLWTKTLP